jgi:hypothetical protein
MDRFVHEQNLARFAEMLRVERDPARRAILQDLLIQEEERLGSVLERLDRAEAHIAEGRRRIERQRELVAALTSGGAAGEAEQLLESFIRTQSALEAYRRRLAGDLSAL